jgi:myosin heavy subunit
MTCISDIDENGINRNLEVRYERDEIYVSFLITKKILGSQIYF